jgi:hypothetical protein
MPNGHHTRPLGHALLTAAVSPARPSGEMPGGACRPRHLRGGARTPIRVHHARLPHPDVSAQIDKARRVRPGAAAGGEKVVVPDRPTAPRHRQASWCWVQPSRSGRTWPSKLDCTSVQTPQSSPAGALRGIQRTHDPHCAAWHCSEVLVGAVVRLSAVSHRCAWPGRPCKSVRTAPCRRVRGPRDDEQQAVTRKAPSPRVPASRRSRNALSPTVAH